MKMKLLRKFNETFTEIKRNFFKSILIFINSVSNLKLPGMSYIVDELAPAPVVTPRAAEVLGPLLGS